MEVSENKAVWDGKYHWADGGDEWSAPWGGVAHQWYGSILPRIMPFVPANHIVEIACGKGRMTQFLKDYACEYCRDRPFGRMYCRVSIQICGLSGYAI
jgi:hypothetical protein